MDNNLAQVKKQILTELGYLSYIEKKKIQEDHDQLFIEKELKTINKKKKFNLFTGIFCVITLLSGIISMFYEPLRVTQIGIFIVAIFLLISSVFQLLENTKRETLYKILLVFNKQNNNVE